MFIARVLEVDRVVVPEIWRVSLGPGGVQEAWGLWCVVVAFLWKATSVSQLIFSCA